MKQPLATPRNAFLAGMSLPVIGALLVGVVSAIFPALEPGSSDVPFLLLMPYFGFSVFVFVFGVLDNTWLAPPPINPLPSRLFRWPSPEQVVEFAKVFPRMLVWFLGAGCGGILQSFWL